jgi:ubiquinone/menaquinone biosynthesis C-methylase UbiE
MSGGLEFDDDTSRKVESMYMTPDVVAQRRRTLDLLRLVPDERVLDIGSGPGLLAAEVADVVGEGGRVCGVDTSPSMVEMAKRRCQRQPWVDFELAEATDLPHANEAFDVAVSTQVYEYVDDVPTALVELHRVLRPGGRALVLDTDWHSIAIHTRDEERMKRVLRAWDEHFVHPRLPRTLSFELRNAGFTVEERDVIPLFNPEYRDDTYSKPTLEIIASFVAGRQGISPEEARAWHDEFEGLSSRGQYFFSINRYVFLVSRP